MRENNSTLLILLLVCYLGRSLPGLVVIKFPSKNFDTLLIEFGLLPIGFDHLFRHTSIDLEIIPIYLSALLIDLKALDWAHFYLI